MRTVILWTHESPYLRNLAATFARMGHQTVLVSQGIDPAAPFKELANDGKLACVTFAGFAHLRRLIADVQPELTITAGWHIPAYVAVGRLLKGQSYRVMSMDNQWRRTAKQLAGLAIFRALYKDSFDAAIVPGPRQRRFARLLGFAAQNVLDGGLPCDVRLFGTKRSAPGRYFFTAGRVAPEKGLDVLLAAYTDYRARVSEPWDLVIAGAGHPPKVAPDGVIFPGFLEADHTAEMLGGCGAFVLASRFEPWGVVLHEAAAAGRFILASEACGAGDVMIQGNVNGSTFRTGDYRQLTELMVSTATMGTEALTTRGNRGLSLAATSTAETFVLQTTLMAQTRRLTPKSLLSV